MVYLYSNLVTQSSTMVYTDVSSILPDKNGLLVNYREYVL